MPRREMTVNFDIAVSDAPGAAYPYTARIFNRSNFNEDLRDLTAVGKTPKEARDCLKLNILERVTRTKVKMVADDHATRELLRNVELHPWYYFATLWREAPVLTNGVLDQPDQTVGYAKTVWDMNVAARKLQGKYMRIYAYTGPQAGNNPIADTSDHVWESMYITNLRHAHITAGLAPETTPEPEVVEPEVVVEAHEIEALRRDGFCVNHLIMSFEGVRSSLWAIEHENKAHAVVTFDNEILGEFDPMAYRDARNRRKIVAFTNDMTALCAEKITVRNKLIELYTNGKLERWFGQMNDLLLQYPERSVEIWRSASEDGRLEL